MQRKVRMTRNGILYTQNGNRVHLDPEWAASDGISFISHAHIDHLHHQNGGTIITSKETSEIAKLRGYRIENFVEGLNSFSMVNSGHIFGARGLLFDDVFYTGDICTRNRGFLKAADIPKCKTLITECTFG
ncbi:MAG: exonuclease, partial [Nitrosopumilaceae archaeon]